MVKINLKTMVWTRSMRNQQILGSMQVGAAAPLKEGQFRPLLLSVASGQHHHCLHFRTALRKQVVSFFLFFPSPKYIMTHTSAICFFLACRQVPQCFELSCWWFRDWADLDAR